MENRISGQPLSVVKISTPCMAFYLASTLGLLLGALTVSLAEPMAGAAPAQEIAVMPESGDQANESLDGGNTHANAQTGQVNIPGAQSAVLTVSREIQTTAPIMNREPKANTRKQAPPATPGAMPAERKAGQGYYLQLPEPKSATNPSTNSVVNGIPTTAASVPVAPIASQTLESELPQPIINLIPQPDPEAQPLDLSGYQSPVSGAATNAMIRVTLGLMAVLGLLLGFAKIVLPRLMARHPEFFENLKQKNQKAKTQQVSYTGPIDIPQTMAEKLAANKKPMKLNLFGSSNKNKTKLVKAEESKPIGGQIEINGKQFNILSSTALGKDKDLHLVEILGRQLVVATTPYTVSLIQDLTGTQPEQTNNVMDGVSGGLIETPVTQLNLLTNGPIKPIQTETIEEVNDTKVWEPETTNTGDSFAEALDTLIPQPNRVEIAKDLDDQPPPASEAEFIRAKSNPYNSVPKFSELRDVEIDTSFLQPTRLEAPADEAVYAVHGPTENITEPEQASNDPEWQPETDEPKNTNGTLLPSLEGIVLLSDYDDVYGY